MLGRLYSRDDPRSFRRTGSSKQAQLTKEQEERVTIQESRLAAIARRGLSLPAETREQVRKIGILCRPQLEIVYQQRAHQWKLRGEESGGAIELLGHYVGFVDI